MTTPDSRQAPGPRQAIEAFHAWRAKLLLPGHQVGTEVPDPELVLSSKMLKVFAAQHPQYLQHIVTLQLHFLEQDYTNRVRPEAWRKVCEAIGDRTVG